MRKIFVNLGKNSYHIIIGYKILPHLGGYLSKLHIGKDAFIITNNRIKKLLAHKLKQALSKEGISAKIACVPDSEKSKSSSVALKLIAQLSNYGKGKNLFIIALGGGVIGDLSGFVAAIYKRGIPYIQIPTTFLGQIDSSIGGKTGIDLKAGKNLLGAFYQPKLVFTDISFLNSLGKREIISGMGEAIKYGIIKEGILFRYIENKRKEIIALKRSAISKVIYTCAKIKAEIVKDDEKETKGIRTILNLGHTIGHAIEAALEYEGIRHGEAVALGILCSCGISNRLGLLNLDDYERIEKLIAEVGLPLAISGVTLDKIIELHLHDKKFTGKTNRFVIPVKIGKVIVKENIKLDLIKQAIKERLLSSY